MDIVVLHHFFPISSFHLYKQFCSSVMPLRKAKKEEKKERQTEAAAVQSPVEIINIERQLNIGCSGWYTYEAIFTLPTTSNPNVCTNENNTQNCNA